MRAECYLLHMTCDAAGCRRRSYEYTGDSRRDAYKVARSDGWRIGKPGVPDLCKDHKRAAQCREANHK